MKSAPGTVARDFDTREHVLDWMDKNQLGKRNLTDGWRYQCALRMKERLAAKAKETQGQRTDIVPTVGTMLESGKTRNEVAKELGWSTGKVSQADYVWKHAEPETIDKVKAGAISMRRGNQR